MSGPLIAILQNVEFETVAEAVRGVPFITEQNTRYLYDLIINEQYEQPLELGFAHGVASCFIAAALDELGTGHLTTVDLLSAQEWQQPSIEELLDRIGLRDRVTIVREDTGYNWFLHREIAARSHDNVCDPHFDFCIVDGPKNWTIDGAAFFMVDKLLRPGGVIVFDDVDWTYDWAAGHSDETDGVRHEDLSEEELRTPQIRAVAELLVMQHPSYGEFVFTDGDWFLARKLADANEVARTVRIEYITPPGQFIRKGFSVLRRRFVQSEFSRKLGI